MSQRMEHSMGMTSSDWERFRRLSGMKNPSPWIRDHVIRPYLERHGPQLKSVTPTRPEYYMVGIMEGHHSTGKLCGWPGCTKVIGKDPHPYLKFAGNRNRIVCWHHPTQEEKSQARYITGDGWEDRTGTTPKPEQGQLDNTSSAGGQQ